VRFIKVARLDELAASSKATSMTNLRLNQAPAVEVHLVHSRESPGGLGEAGTSVVVPAVANAIFAATDKRLRKLPAP
jgi:CO/xanthine dehydrogenase Mo-binding subunit